MPIKQKPTMLEMTAIQAAQALAAELLGMTDHADLNIVAVYKSLPDDSGVRELDVWLQSGKKITVRLANRRKRNPEGDDRWYAISAWVIDAQKDVCAKFEYLQPENVSYFSIARIAVLRPCSLKVSEKQQDVVVRRERRKQKKDNKPEPTLEELLEP